MSRTFWWPGPRLLRAADSLRYDVREQFSDPPQNVLADGVVVGHVDERHS
jgi:hypothetical protein